MCVWEWEIERLCSWLILSPQWALVVHPLTWVCVGLSHVMFFTPLSHTLWSPVYVMTLIFRLYSVFSGSLKRWRIPSTCWIKLCCLLFCLCYGSHRLGFFLAYILTLCLRRLFLLRSFSFFTFGSFCASLSQYSYCHSCVFLRQTSAMSLLDSVSWAVCVSVRWAPYRAVPQQHLPTSWLSTWLAEWRRKGNTGCHCVQMFSPSFPPSPLSHCHSIMCSYIISSSVQCCHLNRETHWYNFTDDTDRCHR